MVEIPREIIQRLTAMKLSSKYLNGVIDIIGEMLEPKQRAKGQSLEMTWSPSRGDMEYGEALGLTEKNIMQCAEDMRLWAGANRNRPVAKKADWGMTFKGWLRREAGRKQQRNGGMREGGNSYRDITDELRRGSGYEQRSSSEPDFFASPESRSGRR